MDYQAINGVQCRHIKTGRIGTVIGVSIDSPKTNNLSKLKVDFGGGRPTWIGAKNLILFNSL
jgi:hypothetical protein